MAHCGEIDVSLVTEQISFESCRVTSRVSSGLKTEFVGRICIATNQNGLSFLPNMELALPTSAGKA